MQDLLTIIKERRSVRNFSDQPVSEAMLQTILTAVQWTPSWANTQCWEIVVVRDKAIREKLQAAVPAVNPAHKSILAAPVVLALCARRNDSGYYKGVVTTKFGDWFMFDLGLAAQSICLTAHSLGLGTVIVGLYAHDQVNAALNLPENVENVALMPLGYPTKIPSPPKRKGISEFLHNDGF
ncbi:MAG: nitroreductase [Desulfobacterales bacterium CG23_combo_of_CG06-09_8_20_14_all_51_8]|nr:MAG: nitroreductase [Desulfobacterales bacterium CG23_combo_of_CG06-09_8_20_14_all_51_8]